MLKIKNSHLLNGRAWHIEGVEFWENSSGLSRVGLGFDEVRLRRLCAWSVGSDSVVALCD